MFGNKRLKELLLEVKELQLKVKKLTADNAKLKENYYDYLEWKKMRDANEETAAKMGHWYISANDAALIEKCIQEINRDEDLCALLTSAEGTTLSLRVHRQPNAKNASFLNLIGKYNEENK